MGPQRGWVVFARGQQTVSVRLRTPSLRLALIRFQMLRPEEKRVVCYNEVIIDIQPLLIWVISMAPFARPLKPQSVHSAGQAGSLRRKQGHIPQKDHVSCAMMIRSTVRYRVTSYVLCLPQDNICTQTSAREKFHLIPIHTPPSHIYSPRGVRKV